MSASSRAAAWRSPRIWAAALLGLALVGNHGFLGLWRNWRELSRLRSQLNALSLEEARLSQLSRGLAQGDAALERLARLELGLSKPGEIEYRFTPPARP